MTSNLVCRFGLVCLREQKIGVARQPRRTARKVESSQLVNSFAEASRVDKVPPDFSRLSACQKPGTIFLNDFFSGAVLSDFERIPQRDVRSTHLTGNPLGLTTLTAALVVQSDRLWLRQFRIRRLANRLQRIFDTVLQVPRKIARRSHGGTLQ